MDACIPRTDLARLEDGMVPIYYSPFKGYATGGGANSPPLERSDWTSAFVCTILCRHDILLRG